MEPYELVFAIVTALIVGVGAWLEWRRMTHQDKHARDDGETQARIARLEAAQEHVAELVRLATLYDQLAERVTGLEECDFSALVAEVAEEPRPQRKRSRSAK